MGDIRLILLGAKATLQSAKSSLARPITMLGASFFGNGYVNGQEAINGIPTYKTPDRFDADGNPLSYSDIQQKSSHNSYNRDESIFDQFQNQNITSFELDIHNGDPGLNIFGENLATDGDFYVYHDSGPNFGNMGSNTHYPHLTDGLSDISKIHELNPNHDVLTLHIDVKDMFDPENGLGPNDLDRVLQEQLGDMLYTPDDLMSEANIATLGAAVHQNGMPTLNDLEGKVMIVLTGGDEELESYLSGTDNPIGFISANPEIDNNGNFVPNEDAVFYNIKVDDLDVAPQILEEDFILRAYGANDADSYQDALDAGVHHIGTDYISPGDNNLQTPISNEIFHQGENIKDSVMDGFSEAKDTVASAAENVGNWTVDRTEDTLEWGADRVDDLQDGAEWLGDTTGDLIRKIPGL